MKFTQETYRENLKLVNNLWMEAIAKGNDVMVKKWGTERNRILSTLNNWSDDNEDSV